MDATARLDGVLVVYHLFPVLSPHLKCEVCGMPLALAQADLINGVRHAALYAPDIYYNYEGYGQRARVCKDLL